MKGAEKEERDRSRNSGHDAVMRIYERARARKEEKKKELSNGIIER